MKFKSFFIYLFISFNVFVLPSFAEELGSVDTAFKFIGPDHKILIEVFDDPKVQV